MYQSILVPFDNSDHARNALAQAAMIARSCGAKVTVLFVSELPDFTDPGFAVAARMAGVTHMDESELAQAQVDFRVQQEEKLAKDTAEIVGEDVQVEYRVKAGKPHDTVVDLADKGEFDLIVMGCRVLGALRGALGSVSFAVARSVSIPVMLVK